MQELATPISHLMLIGGERVATASGETFAVENPGNRAVVAQVPRGGAEDVERAVQAASSAFSTWHDVVPRARGRMLLRIADALEARSEEMARTIATETGNALRTQARPEAALTADIFRYFGGLASEIKGETLPLGEQVLSYSRLFLHASIFDEFLEKLTAKTARLKLGDPLDEATDMGAIINEKQFSKESGIGREFSLEGMLESFTSKKSVTVNLGLPPP